MSVLEINIKGLDGTLRGVENRLKEVERDLQDEFNAWAQQTATIAKTLAPTNFGQLKGSINAKYGQLSAEVTVNVFYAAYLEFGTGEFASKKVATLPKEWQDYAMEFYVNGKGRTPARPFLFPAYEQTVSELKKNLKRI